MNVEEFNITPHIKLEDLIPYKGLKLYRERKEFFYSISNLEELVKNHQMKWELRHLLLTIYNCALTAGTIILAAKSLTSYLE